MYPFANLLGALIFGVLAIGVVGAVVFFLLDCIDARGTDLPRAIVKKR